MRAIDRLVVWGNKEPILLIRRILWIVTAGWALFVAYCFAAVGMALTIVLAPFALQAFKFAWFALDPVTKEPYHEQLTADVHTSPWRNPAHPLSMVANVVWLIFFGWALALLHLAAALIQALTIIGIGTAITNVKLAAFALWPFGRGIRTKFLPTTIEELEADKQRRRDGSHGQQLAGQQRV